MVSGKRVLIATILGLICGVISYLMVKPYAPAGGIPASGALAIILGRGTMGFAIGISACQIRWWLHGIVMGFIFSLPGAFGSVWLGFGQANLVRSLITGIVYGFLTELITAVVFKARVSEARMTAQYA